MSNTNAQTQGMNYREGIRYLAEVGSTYAQGLDKVARDPVTAYLNASLTSIQDHFTKQEELIKRLREELNDQAQAAPTSAD